MASKAFCFHVKVVMVPACWSRAGEIVVFNIDGRDIPIVHRVIKVGNYQSGHVRCA
jgi:hypothetical protein